MEAAMLLLFLFESLLKFNEMATDEFLLDRLRIALKDNNSSWTEKKMFGGNCFMVDDKMCFGTYKGGLMARVDTEMVEQLIKREGAEQMIHGGRPMRGYLFIQPEGYDMDTDIEFWVKQCLDFNPKAKSSKNQKKKSPLEREFTSKSLLRRFTRADAIKVPS